MIGVGDFVLDVDAKRADDTGSADGIGVRGIVTHVTQWVDRDSGELADVLIVATRHHGQLAFVDVKTADVADSWPCGRIDAGGYITLCQRAIGKARRGNVDQRVVELLTLVTRIKESPASPHIGRDARAMTGNDHGENDGGLLARLLSDSTEAHQQRKEAS